MKIYLAGSVPKGDKEAESFRDWRADYIKILKDVFDAEFIDPYDRLLDESDPMAVFGADCNHIKDSSLIIVNAESTMGVGTSQEMVIAKYFKKPVVTVLPKESHYRRGDIVFRGQKIADWVHSFVAVFSDFIIEDIRGIENIKAELSRCEPKDISIIDESIAFMDSPRRIS
jgi:hypothetical protein